MKRDLKVAEALWDVKEGIDNVILALKLSDPNSKTIVWYQDGSIVKYSIAGELEENSIPNKANAIKVEIGNRVTGVGNSAFYNCTNLSSVTIPNTVTSIDKNSFCQCTNLSSITIPNSVTSIGNFAFWQCTNLSSIVLPNTITSIENYTFNNCSKLSSIIIPDSVISINEHAFNECSGLTSVTIGNNITNIGDQAFYKCHNIKEVRISDLALWCNISFEDQTANPCVAGSKLILDNKSSGELYEISGEVYIPNDATKIGQYAFNNRTNITSVYIPATVTSIEDCAFYECSNLQYVSIDDHYCKLKNIGSWAFEYCSLSSITIPDTVTSIGSNAFYGNSISSTYYYIESETIQGMDNYPWGLPGNSTIHCSDTSIIVPNGSSS